MEYNNNKQFGQRIGLIIAVVFAAVGWVSYSVYRGCLPDTYLQSKLNDDFRKAVMESLISAFWTAKGINVSYFFGKNFNLYKVG